MTRLNITPPPREATPAKPATFLGNDPAHLPFDGRVMRGIRSKQILTKTFIRLAGQLGRFPSARQLSKETSRAARTVFHHFPTLDHLASAATIELIAPTQHELAYTIAGLNRSQRISLFVELRAQLCEQWRPVWWLVTSVVLKNEDCRARLATRARIEQDYIKGFFWPEFRLLSRAARTDLLLKLNLLLSSDSWRALRDAHQLSPAAASAFWKRSLGNLLDLRAALPAGR